ncbi:MAG: HAD hydrolase-like protein, partial [Chloroflexota bacterium]
LVAAKLRAVREAGLRDASRAVFVGDRLFDDVFGAQRAGMRAVHRLNSMVPGYEVQPDATIVGLDELVPIIDGWLARG